MKNLLIVILIIPFFLSAQEQFKSSNQRDWEYYNTHPEEVGKSVAPRLLSKRSDLMKTQSMNKVVYGFHPYWQNGSESNYYFSLLTHLVYFSADIDAASGGFTTTNNWASAAVVTQAKQYGLKVHLCLVLFANHSTLLSSTNAKNALIANTLAQLAVRNADGVNIDFESMSAAVKTDFRVFMKQFGDSLKAHGKEFVIELPAVDWSNIFDATFFSTLSPVTDFYFCMLYDYWWSGSSNAGPNSPLQSSSITNVWHVLRSIDTYVKTKGCPANKFIAGFPNYGREWAVQSTAPNSNVLSGYTSSSRTYSVVKNNYIDTIPASRQYWSTTYNTRYYNYVSGGVWRQVWYDDSLTWAKKFDSIKVKNVAGTGMWALGYDGSEPEMWGSLKTAFASSPNSSFTSLDNFEKGLGHFTDSPSFSGTTLGIAAGSTSAYTNDIANNGSGALQLLLKDNTSSTGDWYVRFLSGGGTPANNISFTTTGSLGFWMKTASSKTGLQTALSIDDGPGGTIISSKQNIIADGVWHLYQWDLPSTSWSFLSGSDTLLNGPNATLDAIMFYASNDASDWTIYLDDVSHNPSGALPVEEHTVKNIPTACTLEQNYPNPFNPSTVISYQISENRYVTLKVYDMIGREVAALVNEMKGAGTYSVNFNASKLSSGIYFYTLRAGNFLETKRMLLLR